MLGRRFDAEQSLAQRERRRELGKAVNTAVDLAPRPSEVARNESLFDGALAIFEE